MNTWRTLFNIRIPRGLTAWERHHQELQMREGMMMSDGGAIMYKVSAVDRLYLPPRGMRSIGEMLPPERVTGVFVSGAGASSVDGAYSQHGTYGGAPRLLMAASWIR